MRWKQKPEVFEEFTDGDIRVVRKFLWRKTTLNGETRWLEFADIRYGCWISKGKYRHCNAPHWVELGWNDGVWKTWDPTLGRTPLKAVVRR